MNRVFQVALGFALGAALLPLRADAQEVWLADLKVEMTATENAAAGYIVHEITVTNQFDDSAREIVLTHIPVLGMPLLAVVPQSATCVLRPISTLATAVQCTLATLNVGATEKVWVVTGNTTSWTGGKVTTAQVMGISPDRDGSDNVVNITFP
jgi:hypothetical protein